MSDFLSRFLKRDGEPGEPDAPGEPEEPAAAPAPAAGPAADVPDLAGQLEHVRARLDQGAAERQELAARLAALETATREAVSELTKARARLETERAAAAQAAGAARARTGRVERLWATTPLAQRLRLGRELLRPEAGASPALAEAAGLVELCSRGSELEAWIRDYPALFVEAWIRSSCAVPPGGDAEALAEELLTEARELLRAHLGALGLEWIQPAVGDPVTGDHSVAGDEAAPGVPDGRIARVGRAGLRWAGRVHLPAQVFRARGGAAAAPAAPAAPSVSPAGNAPAAPFRPAAVTDASADGPPPALPTRGDWPSWLAELARRAAGGAPPEVAAALESLSGLAAETPAGPEALRDRVLPLLPLLGPFLHELPDAWVEAVSTAQPEILRWLRDSLGLEVLAPGERTLFVPGVMEAAGTRRTAHPHEDGRVARVERVGLLRNGQVFIPARVVRYAAGEDW